MPTLLIWGEFDARSPLEVARQFEQAIPDAKLTIIEGAGHVSNLERPDEFNAGRPGVLHGLRLSWWGSTATRYCRG